MHINYVIIKGSEGKSSLSKERKHKLKARLGERNQPFLPYPRNSKAVSGYVIMTCCYGVKL